MSSNNKAIQIHILKLDNPEKSIIKLQNKFKDFVYMNKDIQNLSVKTNLKVGAQILQKGRPMPIQHQDQVAQEVIRLIEYRYLKKQQK